MAKRALSPVVFLVLLLVLVSAVAQASHISGIRITETGINDFTADVDITAFYTTGSTTSTATIGYSTSYSIPAVSWGDGSTVSTSTLPVVATSTVVNGVPARAYRGSFSHTYGAAGTYTITANTICCPVTTPTYPLVTGAILTTMTVGPFGTTTLSFIQNTLAVSVGIPVVEVPTASQTGLAALALLLGLAAVVVLRRAG